MLNSSGQHCLHGGCGGTRGAEQSRAPQPPAMGAEHTARSRAGWGHTCTNTEGLGAVFVAMWPDRY